MRVHVCAVRMTLHRADVLEAYLNGQDNIQKATVYERTGDVVLTYRGSRKDAAALLAAYRFDNEELEVLVTSHDSRKINQEYQEKMVNLVAGRVFRKVFLPAPIAAAYTVWRSIAFIWKGIRCLLHRKLEVEVLDALSITASLLRGDYSTAGSVNAVYDLMMRHHFHIVRSVRVKIDHNLLARPGAKLSGIREIYSHEQALSQCESFLHTLKDVKITPVENTAVAARLVAESPRRDIAAIASRKCAELAYDSGEYSNGDIAGCRNRTAV